jgi:hypothetical protein
MAVAFIFLEQVDARLRGGQFIHQKDLRLLVSQQRAYTDDRVNGSTKMEPI